MRLQLAPHAQLERGAADVEGQLLAGYLAVDAPQHLGDDRRERVVVAPDRGGRELAAEVLLERDRLGTECDVADAARGRGDDEGAERTRAPR